MYGVEELEKKLMRNKWEKIMVQPFLLTHFPEYTSPFWTMIRNADNPKISEKVDVLMHGMETIGSAKRSCDPNKMSETFYSIEEGKYAQRLLDMFEKKHIEAELE